MGEFRHPYDEAAMRSLTLAVLEQITPGEARLRVIRQQRRADRLAALSDLDRSIYAIRTPDDLIKIGFSQSLGRRLRSYGINLDNIEDLLMVMPGTLQEENALHKRFRPHLIRGREYYRPARPIIEFVNGVRVKAGIPPLQVRAIDGEMVTLLAPSGDTA